jgi:hypothetical protein
MADPLHDMTKTLGSGRVDPSDVHSKETAVFQGGLSPCVDTGRQRSETIG